ncbi:hypothetical protein ACET3X_000101 [Alternaria dauci]|uniref:Heterokaryon incompatibility domain-containing protein n=1 Tax=Alternaria dauci TaxID=48095 RepID=A0ABR3UVU2_9PLEO
MLPIYGDSILDTARGEIRLLNFLYHEETNTKGLIELELDCYLLSNSCTQYIEFEKTKQEDDEDDDAECEIRGKGKLAQDNKSMIKPHAPNLYHYVAVSYSWGPDVESEKLDVLINGHVVKVRKNLHAALLEFRAMEPFKQGLKLWIDAITINQDNEVEKQAQILIMHEIYQRAGNIVVWIGPDVEQTFNDDGNPELPDYILSSNRLAVHRTIGMLEQISQYYQTEHLEEMDECGDLRKAHQHREAAAFRLRRALQEWNNLLHENPDFFTTYLGIHEFFSRPYWRRLWVIQELSMGRAGMPIVCGSRITHWRHIRDAAILLHSAMDIVGDMTMIELGKEELVDTKSHTASHVANIAQLEFLSHRKRLPWIDKSYFEFRSTPGIGGGEAIRGSTLDQALQLAMEADCFNPKDRVFGMLHIHGIPDSCKRVLDYSKSPAQIYTAFAKQLLRLGKLEVFALLDGCQDDLMLPSWVPNFIRPASRRATPIHGPWFAGTRNKFDNLDEQTLRMLPGVYEDENSKEILHLHGVTLVDVVDGVGAIQPILQKRIASRSSDYAVGVVQPSQPKTKTNPVYMHEHTVKRCLYRTLTCSTDITGHQREFKRLLSCFAPNPPKPIDPDFWNWDFFNASSSLIFHGKSLKDWLDPYKERPKLQYATDYERKEWGEVSAAMAAMKSKIRGRRLFVTAERGFLGLGPMNIQPGNILVTVYGCAKPLILLPLGSGRFRIQGECYVDDIMGAEVERMDIPDENIGSIIVE